jgi:hypothetical protein
MEIELPPVTDLHPWRTAIVLGLMAIVGGIVVSTVVPALLGRSYWWTPGDAWRSLRAAHYIPHGAYPLIYETETRKDLFDAGPLLPLVLAPVAWIGDVFHLHESYPLPRQHPSMWPLFGTYGLASAIPLLYAVRATATQLLVRSGRTVLQIGVLLLAFVPMAIVYGHYEDVLALALVLIAFREAFAERPLRGALCLAAAIAFKQWSVLAVPVFVVACPEGIRRRALMRSVFPPALFMSAFLATDYKWASAALLHPPAFPFYGHAALWVSPRTEYVISVPERGGALVIAVLVAWLIRKERDPAFVISALGCVLLARFLFEPAVHSYYLAPGITTLLVAESCRGRRIVTKVTLFAIMVLAFPLHPDRTLWWAAMYALTALALWEPLLQLVRRSGERAEVRGSRRFATSRFVSRTRGVAFLSRSVQGPENACR